MKKLFLLCLSFIFLLFVYAFAKNHFIANSQEFKTVDSRLISNLISERIQAKSATSRLVSIALPNNLPRFEDLNALAKNSQLVVVGSVENLQSKMTPKGDFINTDCQIRISQVIKGATENMDKVIVRVPGGHVDFEEERTAEIKMPDFWKSPSVGETYIFFLTKEKESYFRLVGGPQGLFKIISRQKIESQTRQSDVLAKRYNGKDVKSFISEVSGLTKIY